MGQAQYYSIGLDGCDEMRFLDFCFSLIKCLDFEILFHSVCSISHVMRDKCLLWNLSGSTYHITSMGYPQVLKNILVEIVQIIGGKCGMHIPKYQNLRYTNLLLDPYPFLNIYIFRMLIKQENISNMIIISNRVTCGKNLLT